jgi:hypothetical protein
LRPRAKASSNQAPDNPCMIQEIDAALIRITAGEVCQAGHFRLPWRIHSTGIVRMAKRTPLCPRGWNMPLHYGSQIEEYHRVRSAAGLSNTIYRITPFPNRC